MRKILIPFLCAVIALAIAYSLSGDKLPQIVTVPDANALGLQFAGPVTTPTGGGGGCDYDLCENFETPTTGYENGGWTEPYGSPVVPYSTSGLSLEGDQCAQLSGNTERTNIRLDFSQRSTIYVYALIRFEDLNTSNQSIVWVLDPASSMQVAKANIILAPNQIRLYSGSENEVGDVFSADTTYHIWFEYSNGAFARAGFSSDGTKPTMLEITTGVETEDIIALYFGGSSSGGGNIYVDKIRVSYTDAIGSNPE